jgi:N6-L-threonylcarbamoyladenine synthase
MTLLAIETSCDETSAAVIRKGTVLSNIVSSQVQLHTEYGGVVPELATREHLRNLPPVARKALEEAQVDAADLEAVAATRGPGLPNALLIGYLSGQSMAYSLDLPFWGIHHHEAHLYSPWISGEPARASFEQFQPSVSLIVSGGHTLLVHLEAELKHRLLGSTVDDAAGECFDKVAKLIGLPYPGGPALDKLAAQGNPSAYSFPRPMLNSDNDDFSFSGLKTSVRYFLRDNPSVPASRQAIADLCASVQAAIVEVLSVKTVRASERLGVKLVTASGGVTANSGLRGALQERCRQAGIELRLAGLPFCTDNAAMIGILAERKIVHGQPPSQWDSDIIPNWNLGVLSS